MSTSKPLFCFWTTPVKFYIFLIKFGSASNLPWWPSCLDPGALNNVDAPGCGTSVVRGPTGHK